MDGAKLAREALLCWPWNRRSGLNDRFDKFTDRARKVLTLARTKRSVQPQLIGTGICSWAASARAKVARAFSKHMNVELGQGPERPSIHHRSWAIARSREVGLTPRAKRVIELAIDEARRLGHNYIGTDTCSWCSSAKAKASPPASWSLSG